MKVIVMGCGRVGEQVSRFMVEDGHQVRGHRPRSGCSVPPGPGV